MALTEEQKKKLNTASLGFLGGHGRNFLRSMNPSNKEPLEPVQPWGEARAAALNPAIGSPQAAQPSPTQQGPGFHRRPTESPATAAAVEPQPNRPVVGLQPYGVKRAPVAPAPASSPAPAQQATVSPRGFTVTPDSTVYGGHIRSIGTPGTDGSGYGYTSGPARQQQSPEAFLADVSQQNRQGRGQVGGYSFEGSGADFAKFARQPTRPALQGGNTAASERPIYQQVRDRYEAGGGMEKPKYLGPESGLGWKTRLAKYNAELDAYEKATGDRSAMDLEAMRQAGAGQRTMAEANARILESQANRAEQRRQFEQGLPGVQAETEAKQLDLGFKRKEAELIAQLDQETDPARRKQIIDTLRGVQRQKVEGQNIQTVDVPNPDDPMGGTIKVPARINEDGTYTRLQEQGGQPATAPPDPASRQKGAVYSTPKGPLRWNGQAWEDVT